VLRGATLQSPSAALSPCAHDDDLASFSSLPASKAVASKTTLHCAPRRYGQKRRHALSSTSHRTTQLSLEVFRQHKEQPPQAMFTGECRRSNHSTERRTEVDAGPASSQPQMSDLYQSADRCTSSGLENRKINLSAFCLFQSIFSCKHSLVNVRRYAIGRFVVPTALDICMVGHRLLKIPMFGYQQS
jgi:hypothetical protein